MKIQVVIFSFLLRKLLKTPKNLTAKDGGEASEGEVAREEKGAAEEEADGGCGREGRGGTWRREGGRRKEEELGEEAAGVQGTKGKLHLHGKQRFLFVTVIVRML